MKTGKVAIDLDRLTKDFPLAAKDLIQILKHGGESSYCEVNKDDNRENRVEGYATRVRIYFVDKKDGKLTSLTLSMNEKYFTFIE